MAEIVVVMRVRLDEEKLDEWVRVLYDPPEDPAPGEPRPGLFHVMEQVEVANDALAKTSRSTHLDLFWLGPEPDYMIAGEITVEHGD